MEALADHVLPKAFQDHLERIFDANNGQNKVRAGSRNRGLIARRTKLSGEATQTQRRFVLRQAFAQLFAHGYQLRRPENIGERHIEVVVRFWGEQNLSPSTLRTRISVLNIFSEWIGKKGIVKRPEHYFPDGLAKRTGIAKTDKSWEGQGIDPRAIIAMATAADVRLGAMVTLQHAFGLRMMESVEIRPGKAVVDNGQAIELIEGTKGGLPRRVNVDTKEKHAAIELARRVALSGGSASGRLRWPDCTWKQARNRYYAFMRKLGITKKMLGATSHAFRHGYIHEEYEVDTGFPVPVKGGALGKIDRETHNQACMNITRKVGHGRIDVMPSYCGSYGHALRSTSAPSSADYILKFNVPKGGVHHGLALGV